MEHIIDACSTTLGILGKPKQPNSALRLMKYCIPLQTEDGVLLFNLLTRELLLLTPEEYRTIFSSVYLRDHWFTVPEDLNEKELAELVRWVRTSLYKEPKHITDYTILTTTDCNARCFYCYERGCARIAMSQETAHKVVAYIRNRCGGNKVSITWFGGEPLVNFPVIDQICEGLRAEGIDFEAQMISNAYLFTDEFVARAKEIWNIKKVQITLDGTEEVYNRSKAFIYREGSAYQIVAGNILRLLNADISVSIRLNMDLNNADNLMDLAKELAIRFKGQTKLHVYAHLLFDAEKPENERYTQEERTKLYDALQRLEEALLSSGLSSASCSRLRRDLPLHHCMADSGSSVLIAPDGHLGLCEHYVDREFFGHIDSPEQDKTMIDSWRQHCDPIAECDNCFYYPECIELRKCSGRTECSIHKRKRVRYNTEHAMLNEYRFWRSKIRQTAE